MVTPPFLPPPLVPLEAAGSEGLGALAASLRVLLSARQRTRLKKRQRAVKSSKVGAACVGQRMARSPVLCLLAGQRVFLGVA